VRVCWTPTRRSVRSPGLRNPMRDGVGVRLKVAKELAAHPITASAREITVPQALALSFHPAGLTTVERDGNFEVRALPTNP
jgi:hypothetical protein